MTRARSGTGGNCELRDFLRARRARVTPETAGLIRQPGPRRVPGLRREEVAELAGVSVDYYVRLERGRIPHVSAAVLDAVAKALRLHPTERDHLMVLAKQPHAPGPPACPPQRVREGLYRLLDSLRDTPAMVLGHRGDVLAGNRAARALYTDFDARPQRERNMARYLFLDPAARTLHTDWETVARETIAALHLHAGRHLHDPKLAHLVSDLADQDADFRRWWADHDVVPHTGATLYKHPLAGDLTLYRETFTPTADPGLVLTLYTAEPGSPSEQGLRLLTEDTTPDT
ncbi:Xre family transcriptional regulator [Streptomyces sp. Ag109_O5-1]|uniref:helix-turn-helix transcriptional regulator n=1 Tax=Streptomyces sp. Ag109_O5-1 TaxID=1938851 RepID=UPI000F4FE0B2|nr:helix-turn-helix transcriptional regulator [Streptomyces sp. Ag109_O5-1]RPE40715.1 Xre family transcriptional regulator [Streptomyces sp. Ag109_O5-1]